MRKLAIIGGGAAGLAAAVAAARETRGTGSTASGQAAGGFDVVVFEADDRVGRSILATGNGRCNFSNARVSAERYRNEDFVAKALRALERSCTARRGEAADAPLGANPIVEYFSDLGLVWSESAEGRLYPFTNKASSVVDVLRAAASDAGVREVCEHRAVEVIPPVEEGGRFGVRFANGVVEHARAVIVSCGGRPAETLLPEHYVYTRPRPMLGPLATEESVVKALDGIRVKAAVSLLDPEGHLRAREEGEVLFRKYGVSGIAVFNLSRFAQPGDRLVIDLLSGVRAVDCETYLLMRRKRMAAGGRTFTQGEFLRGMFVSAVAEAVLRQAQLCADAPFGKRDAQALARAIKEFALTVRGIGDERACQVRRGGWKVDAFDPHTLESRLDSGLYVTGEALDVDAPCGGFNLHWAWTSGILAGCAAARRLAQ